MMYPLDVALPYRARCIRLISISMHTTQRNTYDRLDYSDYITIIRVYKRDILIELILILLTL